MNVDMVTTRDLQTWFDSMDAAPRTVRNFRSHASTLFKFAEAREYIAKGENPVTGTEQIKSKTASPVELTPANLCDTILILKCRAKCDN